MGANKQKLDAAVAVELQPNGLQLDSIKRFNQILVSKSNGLLAPLTGEERSATLGCGHTAAFCNAAAVGGKTPEPSLADKAGDIDLHKIAADPISPA